MNELFKLGSITEETLSDPVGTTREDFDTGLTTTTDG